MTRTIKTFFAATIVVAATAAILIGCKKNKFDNAIAEQRNDKEAIALIEKINKFLMQNEEYKAGRKSDERISMDEARLSLDLAINYEYSQHNVRSENNMLDTLSVPAFHPDQNGNVLLDDVLVAYNEFGEKISEYRDKFPNDNNILSYFMIKFPDESKGGNDIEIIFDRGVPASDSVDVYPGPFGDNDDWYCGDHRGRCNGDSTGRLSDAAEQLSLKFRFDNTPPHVGCILVLCNVEYVEYIAYPVHYGTPCYVYYEDPEPQSCPNYWLFAQEINVGDPMPCIDHEEMNCHWRKINKFICNPTGELHFSPIYHSPYNQCTIHFTDFYPKNLEKGYSTVYGHVARVRYCSTQWLNPNPIY